MSDDSPEFDTVTFKDFAKSGLGWFSLACAVAPFFVHMTSQASSTVNGVETVTFYRDYAAIVIAPLGLIAGLMVLLRKTIAPKVRVPHGALVLLLSGFHLANGLGVFAMRGGGSSGGDDQQANDPMVKALTKKSGCDSEHLDVCEKSCADGNKVDCNELGSFYAEGTGVKADVPRALELFEKACNADHPDGCNNLAFMLRKRVEPPEPKRALPFAMKACDLGEEDDCNLVGFMYDHGEGVEEDDVKALEYFGRACKEDSALGCRNAGLAELAKSPKPALEHFARGCELKDGQACNEVGVYWDNLKGDERDAKKALAAFEQGCAIDFGLACGNLGMRRRDPGPGVEVDLPGAVAAYEKGCGLKHGTSCFDLGVMYDQGKGVTRDDAKAYELYTKACDLDSSNGCVNAGIDLRDGDGTEQDEVGAMVKFLLACSTMNNQLACMLGSMLTAKDDPKKGKAELETLCKEGFKPACAEAKKVGKAPKKGKKR